MKRVYSLLAIFLIFLVTGPSVNAEIPADKAARVAVLAEKANKHGRVPVIVKLNIPHELETRLSQVAKLAQRANIANAQQVIDRLLSVEAKNSAKRFEFIPYMAMHVDKHELAQLADNPMIADIVEDIPVPPTLAQSTAVVGANTAWDINVDGSGWAVAVLDTGVDKTHPFLSGKVVSEACYSTTYSGSESVCPRGSSTASGTGVNCDHTTIYGCDHGTHVAGIAAGSDAGSSGVAKGANIISIQVFSRFSYASGKCPNVDVNGNGVFDDPCVLSYTSNQVQGLERVYALRSSLNIASVNMSLGGGQYTGYCDNEPAYTSVRDAINQLKAANIATVIASGNNGYKNSMNAPGCISSAISVGATCDYTSSNWPSCTSVDAIPSYSNIAPFISLLAPGSAIRSSVPDGAYGTKHGTSMATPHVAGIWALMKQMTPSATVDQVLSDLQGMGVTVNDERSGGTVTGMQRISLDTDGDGVIQTQDNCPAIANADQSDLDVDGVGDVCDPDMDGDLVDNDIDNCPTVTNADQSDIDGDSFGDSCDSDMDGDGLSNSQENGLGTYMDNPDSDGDGLSDGEEVNLYSTQPLNPDSDGDGLTDGEEVQTYATDPLTSNLGDLAPRGNPDGALNAGDLVVLSRIIFDQVTPTTLESLMADINQDGVLNVVDFMLLQKAIMNNTPL